MFSRNGGKTQYGLRSGISEKSSFTTANHNRKQIEDEETRKDILITKKIANILLV